MGGMYYIKTGCLTIQGQQKPWECSLSMSCVPLHMSVSFFLLRFLSHSVTLEEEDDLPTVTKLHVKDQTTKCSFPLVQKERILTVPFWSK